MTARVVATGAGAEASGSGSFTNTVLTVPANVADTDVAVVVATWQATALETPPVSTMLGGTGWTTLVAPRTDGTMGWAVYAGRGLVAGDLIVHQLAAARAVMLLDIYVRDAAAPSSWVAGATNARSSSNAITLAAGMALADAGSSPTGELNLAISVERTTATGTAIVSTPGATTVLFREAVNATNLTSVWFGQLPGLTSPSSDVTITVSTPSANGAALQLAVPSFVATSGLLKPNTELVAVAWLKAAVAYLGSRVATELPKDTSTWSASGFTTVAAAGGDAPMYVPLRHSVVGVQTVAVAPSSGKPPWNMASQMAEQIVAATLAHKTVPRRVTMPSNLYAPAFVRSARCLTEPRRVPGDAGDYARFTLDLLLDWVEVPA